jgi:hypothetical protein
VPDNEATELLIKIRNLTNKIQNAVKFPDRNVLYFVSGDYARDSYTLVTLFEELDEILTKNTDILQMPVWWRPGY